jgi:hypothetical protein
VVLSKIGIIDARFWILDSRRGFAAGAAWNLLIDSTFGVGGERAAEEKGAGVYYGWLV